MCECLSQTQAFLANHAIILPLPLLMPYLLYTHIKTNQLLLALLTRISPCKKSGNLNPA